MTGGKERKELHHAEQDERKYERAEGGERADDRELTLVHHPYGCLDDRVSQRTMIIAPLQVALLRLHSCPILARLMDHSIEMHDLSFEAHSIGIGEELGGLGACCISKFAIVDNLNHHASFVMKSSRPR